MHTHGGAGNTCPMCRVYITRVRFSCSYLASAIFLSYFSSAMYSLFLHNFSSGGRVPRPRPQPAQEALGWSGSPPWTWIHLPNFLISIKMFIFAFLISLKCHDEVICCDVMSYPRLQIKAFDLPPFLCEASRPNFPKL